MAPHSASTTTVTETVTTHDKEKERPPMKIVWINVIFFIFLHLSGLYGFYLGFTVAQWRSWLFTIMLGVFSGLGVTAGAHRLWSHRAYKAKWPLRLMLAVCNCIAGQNDIYEWCRDHRVHHKYSETDADPHNVERGFFFSHIGWLMVKKHPDVMKKGKNVDCSDLLEDPIVRFQKRFYIPLVITFCFYLPTYIPTMWGESMWTSFFGATLSRYCVCLNLTWLVNSAAHLWGNRPYNKYISARENRFVALGAIGEGFHNYHHTFPWDYSTSELGWRLNASTMFIDAMAWLGLAYDLKSVPKDMILQRKQRTGEHEH